MSLASERRVSPGEHLGRVTPVVRQRSRCHCEVIPMDIEELEARHARLGHRLDGLVVRCAELFEMHAYSSADLFFCLQPPVDDPSDLSVQQRDLIARRNRTIHGLPIDLQSILHLHGELIEAQIAARAELIYLLDAEGLTQSQIMSRLGITAGEVASVVQRARSL